VLSSGGGSESYLKGLVLFFIFQKYLLSSALLCYKQSIGIDLGNPLRFWEFEAVF
jgi:hypothetical protein